jgi:uroporphyrin-3 C-methyltransferase
VTGVDVQGLFLRLETAKRGLDTLPLRVPEYVQTQSAAAPVPPAARPGPADGAAAPATDSPLAAFRRQITELVRFRRLDEAALKPLLAPDEAVYLELNLRLMLERAQIAALRGDQLIFDESIGTASDWVREYLNTDEPPVRALLDELSAVQSVQLEGDLPDISGSLNALRDVLRNPA